jgi:archaellum component FlaC
VNEKSQNNSGDLDEIKTRIEAMEETIETVCRPVADVFSHERVHAIERSGYEAQLKIEELEKQVLELQNAVKQAQATVSALTNSLTWRALMKTNALLLRVSGRQG